METNHTRLSPAIGFLTLALPLSLMLPAAYSQEKPKSQQAKSLEKEIKITVKLNYLLFLPEGYETGDKKWPLILFLHGGRRERQRRRAGQGEWLAQAPRDQDRPPVRRRFTPVTSRRLERRHLERAARRRPRPVQDRRRPRVSDWPQHGRFRHLGARHRPPRTLRRDRTDLRRRNALAAPAG